MAGGEELSALVGNGATVHGRAWGERGNDDEHTAVPMVLLRGSGVRRRERIDGRGPAAGGGRRRRCGHCRARGSFGFCRDDQGDEAELMACYGRGSYGQGHGQLELELGSNGGSKEGEEIRA